MTRPSRHASLVRPLALAVFTLLMLFGGFGGWSVTARLAGAITAPGVVAVERDRQIVQHPDGGVVREVLVREGQEVRAGQPLLSLDGAALRSDLAILQARIDDLAARAARLSAERDGAPAVRLPPALARQAARRPALAAQITGQRKLFAARRDTFERQLSQLSHRQQEIRAQIAGIAAQADSVAERLRLTQQEVRTEQGLMERGLGHRPRLIAVQRAQAELRGTLGELAANRAAAEGQISEAALAALHLTAGRREAAVTELREIAADRGELAERRRALADRIARLVIRAPVAGRVYALATTAPRAVIRAAEPLLYIVPADRPLTVVAQIPAVAVAEVHAGQEARLRFAALGARSAPDLRGRVRTISADAFRDDRTGQGYYRVEITLDPGEAARLGPILSGRILPGMPVEAEMSTGTHRAIAYLLEPFESYFHHALRES